MISGFQLRDKFANGRTTLENDILLNEQLTPTEKYIYMCLEMLSYKDGFCTATNEQLSDLSNQTIDSIKMCIRRLKSKKYIVVDTKQSRKQCKRRIFTIDRFLKAHWSNNLPKDCTVKKPPLPPKNRLDREKLLNNFMAFRKFVRQYLTEREFNITTDTTLKGCIVQIKKNGYYRNKTKSKDLTREQSAEFERLLWDKRDNIVYNFFEETEDGTQDN